jgi:hypothetical protein
MRLSLGLRNEGRRRAGSGCAKAGTNDWTTPSRGRERPSTLRGGRSADRVMRRCGRVGNQVEATRRIGGRPVGQDFESGSTPEPGKTGGRERADVDDNRFGPETRADLRDGVGRGLGDEGNKFHAVRDSGATRGRR